MKFFYFIIIFILFFITSSGLSEFHPESANAQSDELVFSVADRPYNYSFNYWVEKWFGWFLSLPNDEGNATLTHPRDNYSPEKCSWNQDPIGPAWMLPDGKGGNGVEMRNCKIPEGKAILIQIVGSNCSEEEKAEYKIYEKLLGCANWVLSEAEINAAIDGKEVMNTQNKDKFFVQPFLTNITYAKSNIYGAREGTYRGMEAGYFLFVKPLPVGNHTIQFNESVINPKDVNDKRISNVQYNIQIYNDIR